MERASALRPGCPATGSPVKRFWVRPRYPLPSSTIFQHLSGASPRKRGANWMDKQAEPHVTPEIDLKEIMRMIPHRYPFLMIDKVVNVTRGMRATGVKNVTINEHFFQGHFPR